MFYLAGAAGFEPFVANAVDNAQGVHPGDLVGQVELPGALIAGHPALIVIPALLGVADDTATWNAEAGRKGVPDPFRDGDISGSMLPAVRGAEMPGPMPAFSRARATR